MSRKRKRSPYLLAGFLVASALAQASVLLALDRLHESKPLPDAVLTVELAGAGQGAVTIRWQGHAWSSLCVSREVPAWIGALFCPRAVIADVRCEAGDRCRFQYPRGHRVVVHAEPAKGSYLDGWSQTCLPGEAFYQCTLTAGRDDELVVFYEQVPEDVDLEMVALDEHEQPPDIDLPEPDAEIALLDAPVAPPPNAPPLELEPEALPVEPQQPQVTEPPPPQIPLLPPPPPQQQLPAQPKQDKPPQQVNMKSVEVIDDDNVVKDAPDDAQFLSDKNRDVVEQTHARDTNLEKQVEGDGAYSEQSDVQADDVGAEEDEVAQLEDSEASSLDAEDELESSHSGEEQLARGVRTGDAGDAGKRGDGGDGGDGSEPGALAMRGIEGRGVPGGPALPPQGDARGSGGKQGRSGTPGRRGIKTDLSFEDYERIVGEDKVEEEVALAKRAKSKRRGRWEKKIARVQSSLENFTPEIRPGNQTALKTRAEPFAVYVARMHRRIHELWGFGFLEELDGKSSTHEMNKQSLITKIEVVINPDGTVDKATIVEPSGVLTFDVAALDTIFTAEPFEETPRDIRSPDGKVYLHWRFARDWRQCGTFGVDKFIRGDVPAGGDAAAAGHDHDHDDEAGVIGNPRRKRRRQASPEPAPAARSGGDERAAAARAAANMPDPDDPAAEKAALAWMAAFEGGQIGELVNVSGAPFSSRGQIVANDPNGVADVYRTVIKETPRRRPREWRLLSPAGYRKLFDALPVGADAAGSLFLVVQVGGERLTLTLKRDAAGGYRVVAFDR